MDPFVVLAAASQVTKTIKFGTGVLLVQQRDAIQTAKLVASIDQVSQGRFLFGVGGGWNQDEMENHGTVYASRFKRMRELIEAMKEIWTKPRGRVSRRVRQFWSDDCQAQAGDRSHIRLFMWAVPSPTARAARFATAMAGSRWGGGDLSDVLPKFRQMVQEAERDPNSIEITLFAPTEDVDRLKRYADIGVARVVPMFPPAEGRYGAADYRPVDNRHEGGERLECDCLRLTQLQT